MSRRDGSARGRAVVPAGPVGTVVPVVIVLCALAASALSGWFVYAPGGRGPRSDANPGGRGPRSDDVPLVERNVTDRPIQIENDSYASSRACRACHPAEYASWHDSYHRTMTQVATPQTVVPSFDDVLIQNVYGSDVRLARKGEGFFASFDDPDWTAPALNAPEASRPRIKRQVVMITGSHHQQVYWYSTGHGRLLGQLPAAYLIEARRWIPRRAAVVHPPADPIFSETGHWNSTCIACHATHGKPEFDTPFGSQAIETQNVQTTSAEFGIACEACHGPGEEHVRENRNPLRRYWLHLTNRPDRTAVLPTRLNPRVSSQVCGQCHSVWEFYDQRGERQANSGGLPYKPGDDLSATRFVAQPTRNSDTATMKTLLAEDRGFINDSFWPDGMIRVTGREYNGLVESPCFKHATDDARTLTCFSCHAMHQAPADLRPSGVWADAQLAPGMDGNEACLRCHQFSPARPGKIDAHTHHRSESAGSSCYNCHMPNTTYGLLKTVRSHQISSPSVAASVTTGRLNACNLCHLDQTLAWTSQYLEKWYAAPKTLLGEDETSVAASLLWLLRGDAAERVLIAQAFGWQPAQHASGTAWMPFYLAQLMDDPYEAIRFIAYRSLRGLPGFETVAYDFVAPSTRRLPAVLGVIDLWRTSGSTARPRADPQLLFNSDGSLRGEVVTRLLNTRSHRRVLLRE
jgi:hypothetical protein